MKDRSCPKTKKQGSVFAIQLLECALVAVFVLLSLMLSGQLIYTTPFPLGLVESLLIYVIIASAALIFLGINQYFRFESAVTTELVAKLFISILFLNFVFIAMLYFTRSIRLSPYYFVTADSIMLLLLFLIKRFSQRIKAPILRNRLSLVVGKSEEEVAMAEDLIQSDVCRVGFITYEDPRLREYLEQADRVFLPDSLSIKTKDRVVSFCVSRDKKVFIVPQTYEIAMRKSEMTQVGDTPIFSVESFYLSDAQSFIKRVVDIALSLAGIVVTLPIMLYASIRIKLEDGGPVFYMQERAGRDGKVFSVLKFRSMVPDAEKHTGAVFASEDDPRITKIGRWIRATRIDEIPQFFNVLAGSMSLVGPRPERPIFVTEFSKELPEYENRLMVKPGITGLAQVMGNYTTSAENKIKFDFVYIRNYSLWLDIRILFKTVQVVFRKEQAAGFCGEAILEGGNTFDPETVFCNLEFTDRNEPPRKAYRGVKVAGLFLCCTLVVVSSMFMRYSTLAVSMIDAAMPQNVVMEGGKVDPFEESSEEPVEGDYEDEKAGESEGTDEGEETQLPNAVLGAGAEQEIVLTDTEIDEAIGKLSIKGQIKIALQLLSKLSTRDLIELEKLAEGGFSREEKEIAKAMMYEKFDDEEIEFIKAMYREYVR